MSLFKRITTVSLGLGLLGVSAPAFADHDFEPQPRNIFAAYDRNGDRWISLAEFQAYDLSRCRAEFAGLDYNDDGILTHRERSSANQVECEALNAEPSYGRRTRFGRHPSHSPFFEARIRIGSREHGLTWAAVRNVALEHSSRNFARVDCSNDGWISRRELRSAFGIVRPYQASRFPPSELDLSGQYEEPPHVEPFVQGQIVVRR
jgi:hypothetical protein